jgi:Winged helix DNA-binding domain
VSPNKVLSRRALNRATLSRQLLLERSPAPPLPAIHALAGLQAQAPLAPHVGLWSRLAGYRPAALDELYDARSVVRANLMRATVHLTTAEDALRWQATLAPVAERSVQAAFGRRLAGIDIKSLIAAAGGLLRDEALTTAELGRRLTQSFPGYDADALAYGARGRLALAHVPPRGKWDAAGATTRQTDLAAWLGRAPEPAGAPDAMILRYLAAFGPATVQDMQAWSGLTRLSEAVERLLPELAVFRDDQGRALYDLPDAPRPAESVAAPVRFLPEYDNLFFGYADRTRFVPDLRKPPIPPGNGARTGTVFVDGEWRATWKIALPARRGRGATGKAGANTGAENPAAALTVTFFEEAGAEDAAAIESEGGELARFIAGPDVPVAPVRLETQAAAG